VTRNRLLLLGVLGAAIVAFFLTGLHERLSLAELKLAQGQLIAWRDAAPARAGLVFVLVYAVLAGLSLPVAGILMVAAGAVFGLPWGTAIALVACTTGATMAFLGARYLFRDTVEARLGDRLAAINRGLEQDGALYLFMIRLALVFPFFVVNPLLALTRIRAGTFVVATFAGMLVPTLIFVNAGTELARIGSAGDVLSARIVTALALLGVFPLAARKMFERLRGR